MWWLSEAKWAHHQLWFDVRKTISKLVLFVDPSLSMACHFLRQLVYSVDMLLPFAGHLGVKLRTAPPIASMAGHVAVIKLGSAAESLVRDWLQ